MNNAGLTKKEQDILSHLGFRAVFTVPPVTCREISRNCAPQRNASWAMRSLRTLELRKFVEKADPNRYNDITWRITDAGLERLARDKGNDGYRGAMRGTGGASSAT